MTTNPRLLERRSNPSVLADRDARAAREVTPQEAGPEEVEQHSARQRQASQAPTDEAQARARGHHSQHQRSKCAGRRVGEGVGDRGGALLPQRLGEEA